MQRVPSYKQKRKFTFEKWCSSMCISQLPLKYLGKELVMVKQKNWFPKKPSCWQKHPQIMDLISVIPQKVARTSAKTLNECTNMVNLCVVRCTSGFSLLLLTCSVFVCFQYHFTWIPSHLCQKCLDMKYLFSSMAECFFGMYYDKNVAMTYCSLKL